MSPKIPVSVGTVTIRSRSKTCEMKLSARQNFVSKYLRGERQQQQQQLPTLVRGITYHSK